LLVDEHDRQSSWAITAHDVCYIHVLGYQGVERFLAIVGANGTKQVNLTACPGRGDRLIRPLSTLMALRGAA
jgi:hypothetical protein